MPLDLDTAIDSCRTGDLWIFRGRSRADRAIRTLTNAPVNHVGMAVVLEDLPPLIWHAELGRKLPDVWSGTHHSGVQLHDLGLAVRRWRDDYHQQAWLRQLTPAVSTTAEDALLQTIARLDGVSFPSTGRLAWRWLGGRISELLLPRGGGQRGRGVGTPSAAFCAEVVAVTYQEMGILPAGRPSNWYDPGSFWSGDALELNPGWCLGEEIGLV